MDVEIKATDCRTLPEALNACVAREIQFTNDLRVLKEVYVDVLLHDAQSPKPRLLPHSQDVVVYYSAVASLLTLHVRFSQELEAKRQAYQQQQPASDATLETYAREVASTFNRFAPLFQLYGQFTAKHLVVYTLVETTMLRSIDDPTKTKPFRKFLDDAQASGRISGDAGDYLLRLLSTTAQEFNELQFTITHIHKLIPEGPLHDHFGDAVRSMSQTARHIHEQEQMVRRKEQVHAIEEAWGMKLTQPGRSFIREGTLTKVSRRTDIIYTFVLFSDILMYGAPAALGRVTHHRTLSVASIRVQECLDRANAFRIISDEKSFVVVAATHSDKADWMSDLVQAAAKLRNGKITDVALAVDDVNEKGSHAPIWKPDSTTNECYVCHNPFSLLNRRHHCRRCGELVCGSCSPYRLPLNKLVSTSKSDALSRACKPCADIVLQAMPEEERVLYENPEEGLGLFKRSSVRFDSPASQRRLGSHRTTDSVGSIPAPPEESPVSPRPAEPQGSAEADTPKVQKSSRQRVVEEMLSTEKTYVENMRTLDHLFVQPILVDAQSKRPTIGKLCDIASENNLTSMSLFLHSIENLLMINERLLQDLTERIRDWKDSDTIGDIFANYAPLFTMYSQYTDAQEFASQTLMEFREKSREFREFLAEAEANPRCNRQTLQSFLIMPIQRVPRYQLLLQECLKQTIKLYPDHKDIPLINGALEQVKDAANHVNAVVHVRENKNRIFELAAIWRGEKLAAPGRRLIREGPLIKQCRRAPKEFYFLLFNDVLMYGQEDATGGTYTHHRIIDLRSCKVAEQQTAPESAHAAFQILSKAKAFVVYTDSAAQRDAWMNDINNAIAELRAKLGITEDDQTFAAIWVPDDQVKNCTLCDQPFSLVLRRHHCRACGRVCCALCSGHRRVLPHIDATKPVRICNKCSEKYAATTDVLTNSNSESRSSGRDTAADVRGAFMEERDGDTEASLTPITATGAPVADYDSSDDEVSSVDSDEEDDGPTAADIAALANSDGADVTPRASFVTRTRSKTRDAVGLQIRSFPVQVFALYDYFPQEDGELALTRQQVLTATEAVADRLFGTNQDGASGWFPASYVSVLVAPASDGCVSEPETPQA